MYDVWKVISTPFGKTFTKVGDAHTDLEAMSMCEGSGPGHYRINYGIINRKVRVKRNRRLVAA